MQCNFQFLDHVFRDNNNNNNNLYLYSLLPYNNDNNSDNDNNNNNNYVSKHLYLFQRPQVALALQAGGILVSLKNLLMLIYTKMQLQSCYYPAKLNMKVFKENCSVWQANGSE